MTEQRLIIENEDGEKLVLDDGSIWEVELGYILPASGSFPGGITAASGSFPGGITV